MGKGIIIGLAVFAIVAIVVIAGFFGFITIPGLQIGFGSGDEKAPESAEMLYMSDLEIFQALDLMTAKNLSYPLIKPFIDGLHMKMWGVNDQLAYETLLWYENEYANDSYTSISSSIQRGTGWTVYLEAWNKDMNGRAVSIGDGSAIKFTYGYDTMILTSYGPLTDYYDFWRVINT